jgi:hypothetical protein
LSDGGLSVARDDLPPPEQMPSCKILRLFLEQRQEVYSVHGLRSREFRPDWPDSRKVDM